MNDPVQEAHALAGYHRVRDRLSLPLFRTVHAITALEDLAAA